MWRAFLEDLLLIGNLSIVTTWDSRLSVELGPDRFRGFRDRLDVHLVRTPDEEHRLFRELCATCDTTYVIAPELNDELSRRVTVATQASPCRGSGSRGSGNSEVNAIDLCGDKWALFQHFRERRIATIPTVRINDMIGCELLPWPRVLKLRMGAGSQSMQTIHTLANWNQVVKELIPSDRLTEVLVQPLIRGESYSMGGIIDREGIVHLLPLAEQRIDMTSEFAYLGGRIPADKECSGLCVLVRQAMESVPGLRGFVGVDVLLPESSPESPLIVEINPRLTTSYIGYRALCCENLASLWVDGNTRTSALHWKRGTVDFDASGAFL